MGGISIRTTLVVVTAILACTVMECCASAMSTYIDAPPTADLSTIGPLPVETLEFPNLVDPRRSSRESMSPRHRLFSRLRQNRAKDVNSFAVNERRIPIKVHLPATGGPYPVIIVSHGAGGNWDTHYAQAQHLASHGYAVLCLEHVGSNTDRLKNGLRLMDNLNKMIRDAKEVLGRPQDVSFAVDRVMDWNTSHEKLRGRLDSSHIGVLGHSFGAYTTMVICGVRPTLDWLEPPDPRAKGLGPTLRDARVACGVALSPQGVAEPFFINESFATLSAPLMGISGTEDKQQGIIPPTNRYKAFSLWPQMKGQHKFVWLANAHHLDFTDATGSSHQGLRSGNRQDVQPLVRAATLLFFNVHLKRDTSSEEALTTNALQGYLRGAVDSVEVRSK